MKLFKGNRVKRHLIVNFKKNKQNIDIVYQGKFCIFFKKGGILNIKEYKALIFFLKKKLKFFSKLFIRVLPNCINTKKSIGLRMGKGKGPLNEEYINVSKGQVFIEFGFNNKLNVLNNIELKRIINYFKKIVYVASFKTNSKLKLLINI